VSDAQFYDVCSTEDLPSVMPKRVTAAGLDLLLCRRNDGTFVAISEFCPHRLASMAYGVVMFDELICPHHQYRFSLSTGACNVRRCPPVDLYDVVQRDGRVLVRVPQESN